MPLAIGGPRSSLGSKAFDLYRCVLLGANVPDFRVVPAGYFRGHGEGMDEGLRSDLEIALKELGGSVAVRSSCIDEDLEGASNAGKYSTVLNVGDIGSLFRAVKDVRSSGNGSEMAVIVQRQLRPTIAGVLFTIDPVTMEDRTVIEYVKGVVEALVQGRIDPKRVIIPNGAEPSFPFGPLVRTASKLSRSFGYPLDIEWAVSAGEFFILQARPITALGVPLPKAGRTYSRVQAEQFNSGPVSPLYYSFFKVLHERYFVKDTLEELGIDIYSDGSIIRHKDHLYFDTRYMEYALSRIPANDRLRRMVPEDILGKRRRTIDPILALRVLRSLLFNPKLWIWNSDIDFHESIAPKIVSRLGHLEVFCRMTNSDLKDALTEIVEIASLHITNAKWGLALYSIPLAERSSGSIGSSKTSEALKSLEGLADMARSNPSLLEYLDDDIDDLNGIEREEGGELFLEGFRSVMRRFGHRRLARDLMHPSWGEDPRIILSMVKKMAMEPKKIRGEGRKRERPGLVTRYADRYAAFREDQRFYLDMIFTKARELFLEIGRRMEDAEVLHDRGDVFFISIEDAIGWLGDGIGAGLAQKATFNKLSFDPDRPTPGRYMRLGVDFDSVNAREDPIPEGDILGEAISPGSFRGRVRVISHADEGFSVEKGDVVVAKALDPGQTHLLSLAGALVLEVGGILSHGAILARELGIPTVGQVKDATRILKSGQVVAVDGTHGRIALS